MTASWPVASQLGGTGADLGDPSWIMGTDCFRWEVRTVISQPIDHAGHASPMPYDVHHGHHVADVGQDGEFVCDRPAELVSQR